MTLTLARCASEIRQTLRGAPEGDVLTIVNRAGQWFVDAFSWSWLQRTSSLSTAAGVNYVDLGGLANFRKLFRASYASGTGYWLEQCDPGYMSALRALTSSGLPTYCSVGFSVSSAGVYTKRLELYPTPSAMVTDALTLYWQAGWQAPQTNADESVIAIPDEVEGLYVLVLRAFARGFEEEHEGSLSVRLDEIVNSNAWLARVSSDSATQTNFGRMRGSAIRPYGGDETTLWNASGSVPDP